LRGNVSVAHRVQTNTRATLSLIAVFVLLVTLSARANAGPNEDILSAAKAGDLGKSEAALAAGASVNAVDEKGLSPIGLAGLTPLGLAAAYGHRNIAEFLLDQGASIGAKGGLGETPLHVASEYGYADVAALLLKHGADIDARDIVGATPLQWAALRGNVKVVELLIARGAIVNAQSSFGKTALHLAAAAGHSEIAAFLVAHGADLKIRNGDGQTPLQEMRASSLDRATKAKLAVTLGAKLTPAYDRKPVAAAMPPQPAAPQAPSRVLPVCTDVAGIARVIMQANPGIGPAVLASAIEKVQIAMGCRQAPQKTECCWIGSTTGQPAQPLPMPPPIVGCVSNGGITTCNNSSPTAPLVTCLTIGGITTCN
jgi:ankyrin repeat protein